MIQHGIITLNNLFRENLITEAEQQEINFYKFLFLKKNMKILKNQYIYVKIPIEYIIKYPDQIRNINEETKKEKKKNNKKSLQTNVIIYNYSNFNYYN